MNDLTPKEAIANLNHIYGMVAPDIQRSLDVAIKALERPQCNQIAWEQGYEAGLAQGKHGRPKGEWVAIEPYTHKTFCPFCKEDTRFEVGKYDNFCPNCGADMRGAENEKSD